MTNVLKWDWTSRWNINNALVRKGAVGLLVLHIVEDLMRLLLGLSVAFSCKKSLAQEEKIQNGEAEDKGTCHATFYSSEILSC